MRQGRAPPYSQSALTGATPRAARASLTGWSCQAICISLSSRRHGRVSASCFHQSFSRRPAAASGLAVAGRKPSGRRRRQRRVQRLGREAGAVEQRPHGVVQRGAFLGAQVHLVRIGQHGLVRAQRQVRQFGQPDRLAVLGLVLRQQGAQAGAQGQAGLGPVAGAAQLPGFEGGAAVRAGRRVRCARRRPAARRAARGRARAAAASSAATGRAGRAPGITISMGGIVVWRWRELRPAAICHRWIRLVLEPHIRGPDFLAVNAIMRSC